MFPDSDDTPARGVQLCISVAITPLVALDLLAPPICVSFGPSSVQWTAVPEAPVYIHGHTKAREYNISASAYSGQRSSVDEEP